MDHEQQQSLLEDRATEEKPQAHPQLKEELIAHQCSTKDHSYNSSSKVYIQVTKLCIHLDLLCKVMILLSCSKSQTLISAFGLKDWSIFRTASEDTESTGTIRNLRKSFANLFSE